MFEAESDYWHPPECVKHKTTEGCKLTGKCAFLHADNNAAPSNKSKEDSNSDEKATIAIIRRNQKLVCAPQDVPNFRTNGCTYERETVRPEEEWHEISESTS